MINNLNESVELMTSSDYKDRFKAEYYQLEYRLIRLNEMVEKWDNGMLPFKPTVDRECYDRQIKAMQDYLNVLQERAEIEKVDL